MVALADKTSGFRSKSGMTGGSGGGLFVNLMGDCRRRAVITCLRHAGFESVGGK